MCGNVESRIRYVLLRVDRCEFGWERETVDVEWMLQFLYAVVGVYFTWYILCLVYAILCISCTG